MDFLSKLETLASNPNFGQTVEILVKEIEILVKNRNFGQTSKFS